MSPAGRYAARRRWPAGSSTLAVTTATCTRWTPRTARRSVGPSPTAVRSTRWRVGLPLALDNVFAGSDDGTLYAFGTRSGKVQWRYRTGGAINGGLLLDYGTSIYLGNDSGILYDVFDNGNESWSFRAKGAIEGAPVASGGTVYAGSADASVYAVDSETGARIWSYRTGGPVRSGIAIDGSAVYAGSDDGYLSAIDIGSGGLLWRYRTGGAIRSQILAAGGVLYFGSLDHHVYAVATG